MTATVVCRPVVPVVDSRIQEGRVQVEERRNSRWPQGGPGGGSDQPRLYRARLFDAGREVLASQRWPVVLDLTPGAALADSAVRLDELLRSLLRTANVRADKVGSYYLDVREWETDQALFCWPVTWADRA